MARAKPLAILPGIWATFCLAMGECDILYGITGAAGWRIWGTRYCCCSGARAHRKLRSRRRRFAQSSNNVDPGTRCASHTSRKGPNFYGSWLQSGSYASDLTHSRAWDMAHCNLREARRTGVCQTSTDHLCCGAMYGFGGII